MISRWLVLLLLLSGGNMARAETWRVVYNEFPPYSVTTATGQPVGFAIDLLRAAVSDLDVELAFIRADNPGTAMQMLADGEADLHPHLAPNSTRAEVLNFTTSIKSFQVRAYQRRDRPEPADTNQFTGLRIGVAAGSLPDFLASRYQAASVVRLQDNNALFFALAKGEVDLAFYADNAFESIAVGLGVEGDYRSVGPVLSTRQVAMGVRRARPGILQPLDSRLRALVDTPEYWAIHANWFGGGQSSWYQSELAWLGALLAAFAAGMATLLGLMWRRSANRRAGRHAGPLAAERDGLLDLLESQKRDYEACFEEARQRLRTLSNDLKPPLVSISGFAEMLREARREDHPETRDQMLDTAIRRIQAHVEDMRRMIAGLGDMPLFEKGRAGHTRFSLDEMALDLRARLGSTLSQKNCELEVPPLGDGVGDPALIREALRALVEGALETEPHATPACIQFVKEEGNKDWSIGVHYSRPPVQHGDASLAAERRTGRAKDVHEPAPGLSVAEHVARRHGGLMRVVEEPQGGVTVWLTVPNDPSGMSVPSRLGDAA